MLKVDPKSRKLSQLSPSTLTQSNILERDHLQQAIISSWDAFCGELGFEELFLVGSEIEPHPSCRDRIDILAIDGDGHPVVFELKRDRDKLQLLQAISYAAMISKWDSQDFLNVLSNDEQEQTDELRGMLRSDGFEIEDPRIVLLAESFDPEVILSADWLSEFQVDITAFAISVLEHENNTLISIDQRFPLLGVDDVYVRRGKRRIPIGASDDTWEEVLNQLDFPFARKAHEIFRRQSSGSPDRRAFFSIYSDRPLGRMRIYFRKQFLKIYTVDQSPEAQQVLENALGRVVDIETWGTEKTRNSGFTFTISTDEQFQQFLSAIGEA